MAERSGAGAFSWFVIGALSGIAGTLAVLIFLNRGSGQEPARATAPPPAQHAAAQLPAKPELKPALRPAAAPLEPVGPIDEQVQEDAAAAGMTSRTQASSSSQD